jgi:putative transposase
LVEAIAIAREKHDFALLAYVIMPEHVHLLIQPGALKSDTAGILKAIKQPVSRKAKRFLQEENPTWVKKLTVKSGNREVFRFWQAGPGYDRNMRDEKELSEKIQYIHGNPVKNGLVATPEDWIWSSASWYLDRRGGKITIDTITDKPSLVRGWEERNWGSSRTSLSLSVAPRE